MTPWVLRLLMANGIVYLLQLALPPNTLENLFAFTPAFALKQPWTIITYMFLHDARGFGHILFNMLSLFFFGPKVESRLGGRRFAILYFVSGMAGAILSAILAPSASLIGASGAIFGVMLAFARFWPRDQILIWGILPVEARVMVIAMTIMAVVFGFTGAQGGIAHFAHLGGFIGGWLSLRVFEGQSDAKKWQAKVAPAAPRESSETALNRWRRIRRDNLHEVNRAELDRILDKISSQGMSSLSAGDKEFLERFAAREGLN